LSGSVWGEKLNESCHLVPPSTCDFPPVQTRDLSKSPSVSRASIVMRSSTRALNGRSWSVAVSPPVQLGTQHNIAGGQPLPWSSARQKSSALADSSQRGVERRRIRSRARISAG